MTNCKEFCTQLFDYLDKELGARECLLIERHLEECAPCALVLESLKTTLLVCSEGVSDEIPEDVRNRLREFLKINCRAD